MQADSLAASIARVQERIAAAACRAGRDPADITLVAVTKTVPIETIIRACELGLRHLGENRVEEAAAKFHPPSSTFPLPSSTFLHLIGHLQSRKARDAIELFDRIHSIDSVKLAHKLSRLCVEAGRVMPIFLECNVSGEATKYGFRPVEQASFFAEVETSLSLPGLQVEGLMTMAPIVANPEQARPVFAALRQLGEQLAARFGTEHFKHLSMGMSDDFEVAIEEGATMVRIGRALFAGGEHG